MSREPPKPSPLPPSRSLATGCRWWPRPSSWPGSPGPSGPRRGRSAASAPAALRRATCPPTRRIRTPARGSRTSATRCAPGATARSPRPTAATRWAGRWRRSGSAEDGPPIGAAAGLPFEAKGVRYSDRAPRRTRCSTRRRRRDPDGGAFAEVEAEVRYALGSGTRGITYLIERDGFLFQSPIAWFAQQRRWDISPGYGEVNPRPNFERAIQRECLFCHTNQVRSVAGTLNRYEPPIFEGHAIGCERCHGPGALHAKRAGESAGPDLTIVNPARLAPALRESVCQQCHLQGWFRFPRAGRDSFDFRPGLPLHRFLAVFVRKEAQSGPDGVDRPGRADGVEPLLPRQRGRAGLHLVPRPAPPAAAGHQGRVLSRPLPGVPRAAGLRPAGGRAAVAGAGRGLHRLPHAAPGRRGHPPHGDDRPPHPPRGGAPDPRPARPAAAPGLPGEFVPRDYHWDLMTEEERREAARDRGVALELAAQDAARRAPTGPPRRDAGRPLARGGGPRPSRRPARPRIPRVRPGDAGPSGGGAPRLRRGPPHRTAPRVRPSLTSLGRWPGSGGPTWRPRRSER